MKNNPDCELCGLCNVAQTICIPGRGKRKAEVMVLGEAPSYMDDKSGRIFSGHDSILLSDTLAKFGIRMNDFYLSTVIKCKTPKRSAKASEIKACKPYWQEDLEKIKPKYVLLLGSVALKAVLGKAKITELHGTVVEKDGIKYFPVYHPNIAIRDPRKSGFFETDIRGFVELITKGELKSEHELNFSIVNSMEYLHAMIDTITKSTAVAFDIETNGLDRFAEDAQINIMGMATNYKENRQWIIFLDDWNPQIVKKILQLIVKAIKSTRRKKEVIAQNGKFDNLWLDTHFGVKLPLSFDTMLAAHLIDENNPTGLKSIARRYLKAKPWDVDENTKKGLASRKDLAEYAAWDNYFTLELFPILKELLLSDGPIYHVFRKLSMPVARAYEIVENTGTYLDINKFDKVEKYVEEEVIRTTKELDQSTTLKDVNWRSAQQVRRVLFDEFELIPEGITPGGEPSTAEDNLRRMSSQHSIIETLLEFRGFDKMKSSFIEGWKKRLHNKRWLHPGFKVSGTVTGRPSSSDPNLQQVPRNPMIRSLVSAPPGWTFFEADYSQVELKIAACVSGESEMLRIFQTGGDIHLETASAASGIHPDKIDKETRKKAKAINFGFLYGMGWKKFMDYSRDKYGVVVTEREAKMFRNRFFEKYPELVTWHARMRKRVARCGFVRTLTGRVRHLPEINSPDQGLRAEAERNAINSPVQGFGAEMTLMALVDIAEAFDPDELVVCGTIHDATVGRVRTELAEEKLREVKSMMENPSLLKDFNIDLPVPITVDVSIGNWGEGIEQDW